MIEQEIVKSGSKVSSKALKRALSRGLRRLRGAPKLSPTRTAIVPSVFDGKVA
eukprot:TRINITY_DN1677_c0_g1_i1.p1 TRINITY_DN1677_c0_g1~~TRINITY_DN1677_c0_g1_i1.p1  ORF type:complete len:53 (+),score=6.13 TRINITY_DN1677_c0_g1_i1:126-284(+)